MKGFIVLLVLCAVAFTTASRAEQAFQLADTDGDGKLSRPELRIFLVGVVDALRIPAEMGKQIKGKIREKLPSMFREADKNKDGFLNLEELKTFEQMQQTFN